MVEKLCLITYYPGGRSVSSGDHSESENHVKELPKIPERMTTFIIPSPKDQRVNSRESNSSPNKRYP